MQLIKYEKVIFYFLSIFLFFSFVSLINIPNEFDFYLIKIKNPDIFKSLKPKKYILPIIDKEEILDSMVFRNIYEKKEKILKHINLKFEYPENDVFKLKNFFNSLLNTNKEVVHILHYGDSQIEGDRITNKLRELLQKEFGGKGIGLMSIVPYNNYIYPIKLIYSDDWEKIEFKRLKNKIKIAPLFFITKLKHLNIADCDNLQFYLSNFKVRLPYTLKKIKLIYSNNCYPTNLNVMENNKIIHQCTLEISPEIKVCEINYKFKRNTDYFFEFYGKGNFIIYAISFESETGVIISNIGVRANSGLEFTYMNKKYLKQIIDQLNVKLIIYQFGINVIPSLKEKNLLTYKKKLETQLNFLKSLDLDVIVIGVTDMATKINGELKSHELIYKLNEIQKKVALKTNCIFWNTLEKMGGENSIIKWANKNPPLAAKDYIHLTNTGCDSIAIMFFNDLINDFNIYKILLKELSDK